MLIKINTTHINSNVLPRTPDPNLDSGIKVNLDLALDLLGSSTIVKNNDLSFAFFEIWYESMEMKNAV